jgi:hypothetical protein
MKREQSVERVAHSAMQEMGYEMAESDVSGREYPVSIPCQLRFESQPEQDTERFHDALSERGWSKVTHRPDRYHKAGRANWQGEVVRNGTYTKLRVIVFRGDVVRIFPREDEPIHPEVAEVIEAIQEGFGAQLSHDPIEQEASA